MVKFGEYERKKTHYGFKYKCPYCDFLSQTKWFMDDHIKREHPEKLPDLGRFLGE